MTALLDSIRRVVAEDAAHGGVTHEVYLRLETVEDLANDAAPYLFRQRHRTPTVLGHRLHIQNVGRDCIATLRDGKIISVTNL